MKNLQYLFICLLLLSSFSTCEENLETQVFDEYNVGTNPSARLMEALLNGAYAQFQRNGVDGLWLLYIGDFTGDHMYNERGGVFRSNSQFFFNFNWDSNTNNWLTNQSWAKPYAAIRNINIILDALDRSQLSEEDRASYRGQCEFMRGTTYYQLYLLFGPVPLRSSPEDDPALGKASEAEMLAFIEADLLAAAASLPQTAAPGQASRAAALGILTKFYLNTKQWQKCSDAADQVIGLNEFELSSNGEDAYRNLFWAPESGNHREFVYINPNITLTNGEGNAYMSHSYPESDYASRADGSDPKIDNQQISGTKNRLYDFFLETFEEGDIRLRSIVSEYINADGELVQNPPDRNSPFKYRPDPNALATQDNNDYAMVRYADILLAKAEAMNEVDGPSQAAMDLVNMVRTRAQTSNFMVADFSAQADFRDMILAERGREFWAEGFRREDLIRHGKLISNRRNHPVNPIPTAEEFRVRFPVPQQELDANPNLEQNPGY